MARVTSYASRGGEVGALITEGDPPSDHTPTIHSHGLNALPWHSIRYPSGVLDGLARAGSPVLIPPLTGVANWGKPLAVDAGIAAIDYLGGEAWLWCGSMGALAGCGIIREAPEKLRAIGFGIGAFSLADIHLNNLLGTAASIETAYGGANYAASDPLGNLDEIAENVEDYGIDVLVAHSTNDPICRPEPTAEFIEATGAQEINMGAIGHTFSESYTPAVVDWFLSHD